MRRRHLHVLDRGVGRELAGPVVVVQRTVGPHVPRRRRRVGRLGVVGGAEAVEALVTDVADVDVDLVGVAAEAAVPHRGAVAGRYVVVVDLLGRVQDLVDVGRRRGAVAVGPARRVVTGLPPVHADVGRALRERQRSRDVGVGALTGAHQEPLGHLLVRGGQVAPSGAQVAEGERQVTAVVGGAALRRTAALDKGLHPVERRSGPARSGVPCPRARLSNREAWAGRRPRSAHRG